MPARILIVEDEESIARLVAEALKRKGYRCDISSDGDGALNSAAELIPDLIVLDVMLPRLDGFEVTRRLKDDRATRDIPIIMLTARREEEDAIAGFAAGASDYVRKPFSIAELAARIENLLKRSRPANPREAISTGGLTVDANCGEAYIDGAPLELSDTEYRLLEALASANGRTVSRDELLRRVWGMQAGDTRTLDVHIFRLRRKIEADPRNPELLHTVHGRGYRLAEKPRQLGADS
ncbi:MAG: response regulator transcription factor, partial [Synergistaceae bacterium]|nr:response regulator transcription factor [Synergistaceae bacterium]